MQDFAFYFDLGWEHIMSWDALDHLLFIMVLCAIYLLRNWKQVLILVTAFTIGHSLTLALSVYDIFKADQKWVEFLIPLTIAATAVFNCFQKNYERRSLKLNYAFALLFGLVHGLGFANTLRFIMAEGESMGWGLFGFNVGLEAGQIVVVLAILLVAQLIVKIAGLKQRWWVWALSGIAFCIASKMMIERWPV